ncbi:class I SAM-dependent methyltransferase [Dactylosporangium sp. NPDC048998]|uniref:class I SAM-dependent methyltransferase n=1 Tax=Dactylosporangium sp. NPDC048998 TaxID=3363976 RepID=UPI003711D9F5
MTEQHTHGSAQFWDDRYRSREQLFSGNPNGVLVAEVAQLRPGRALDLGCGEGADALWLARHGWRVTAVDISHVALQRAAAEDSAGRVVWEHADLATTPPPAGSFDLVSAQYFPLRRRPEHTALRGLLAAVAPGGTLLIVGHDLADLADLPPRHEHDLDPADFYEPKDVADLLDEHWAILINETRPRTTPAPPGTHHRSDTVLRAQRRP